MGVKIRQFVLVISFCAAKFGDKKSTIDNLRCHLYSLGGKHTE